MNTQNHILSKVCLLVLFGNVWLIQAQQQKIKPFEVFQHKKNPITKKAPAPDAKTAMVIHPGKSANYSWNDVSSQWVFNDTSVYRYNSQSWLTSETRRSSFPYNRDSITYDSKARITEWLIQNWNTMSNSWENVSREVYVYDAKDNRIEFRYETFLNTQWDLVYGEKNQYTYDGQGRATENVYTFWDQSSMQWLVNGRETAFTYNGNNLLQFEYQSWNGTGWDNENKTLFVYGSNNVPTQVDFLYWDNNAYENGERYFNLSFHNWCGLYCDETAISSGTLQIWDGTQWNTEERINTTYDVFGGYVQTTETYTNSVWVNDYRDSELYDTKYNYIGYRSEDWNFVNNSWETDYEDKEIHTYNASNQITQTIFQYWNWMTNQLENNIKKEYFDFQTFTGMQEFEEEFRVLLYPNPSNGNCFIEYSAEGRVDAKHFTLKLYDIHGAEVLVIPVTDSITKFEAEQLPAGLYIYQFNSSGKNLKSGKLLIQ